MHQGSNRVSLNLRSGVECVDGPLDISTLQLPLREAKHFFRSPTCGRLVLPPDLIDINRDPDG